MSGYLLGALVGLWATVPVLLVTAIGRRHLDKMRAELDSARSYVDDLYDDLRDLLDDPSQHPTQPLLPVTGAVTGSRGSHQGKHRKSEL